MGLIETLKSAGVGTVSGRDARVEFIVVGPQDAVAADGARRPAVVRPGSPMVSCMMVTNGDREVIRHALECYRRQTYENRELVVVTHPDGLDRVQPLAACSGAPNITVHSVGRDMTLGDCRNLAVARSRGDIVLQWDDDDLYDPLRVAVAVELLTQSPAAAVMLARVLVWWPQRRLAAISERRVWEGSIAVWRDHASPYPSLARGEDTVAVDALTSTRITATYDAPLLYVYTVHERNTWDTEHFQEIFERAQVLIQGDQYAELMRLMSARTPIVEYAADLSPTPQPSSPGCAHGPR